MSFLQDQGQEYGQVVAFHNHLHALTMMELGTWSFHVRIFAENVKEIRRTKLQNARAQPLSCLINAIDGFC